MTTTTTALLLPEVTKTRADRIKAAESRHSIPTGTWTITPNGIRPDPLTIAYWADRGSIAHGEQLYLTAESATSYALRIRLTSAPTDLLFNLVNAWREDTAARGNAAKLTKATEAETEWYEAADLAKAYQAIADRASTEAAEARAAAVAAADYRAAAAYHREEAQAITKAALEPTSTDRADLTQAAALAAVLAIREGIDPNEGFHAMQQAASRAIKAAPDLMTNRRRHWERITEAQAAEWNEAHPPINSIDPDTGEEVQKPCKVDFNVKGSGRRGLMWVQWREASKHKPTDPRHRAADWYLCKEYPTMPDKVSFEVWSGNRANAAEIADNGGINLINDQSDTEQLTALFEAANLTDRERKICLALVDHTAAKHGQAAADDYYKTNPNGTAAGAEEARKAAAILSAMTRNGIYSKAAKYTALSRIKAKLTQAAEGITHSPKPTKAEREARQIAALHRNRKTAGTRPDTDSRPDLVGIICNHYNGRSGKPCIRWTAAPIIAPDAWTDAPMPWEIVADNTPDRHAIDRAKAHNGTPWAYLNAGQAAAVFMAAMPIEDITTISKAMRAAESRRAAAKATLADIFPSWEKWQRMTESERAAARRRIEEYKSRNK